MVLAEAGDANLHVALRAASPITLHDSACWRTDGNSPVRLMRDGATAYYSSYTPIGHTLRRRGRRDLHFEEPAVAVTLLDDPDPRVGKWIEAIWQEPGAELHGWYHGEELVHGSTKLFVPHIGRLLSRDDGLSWRCCGEVLRLPAALADASWRNGFFAGGYGDLCVVPDRAGTTLYLFFTSYHPDERVQGVAVLRLSATDPSAKTELWGRDGWSASDGTVPRPLWPVARGWRYADPDSFWGPAVHYNRALEGYVMLLNRTARGEGDLVQEGIYASLNRDLGDPRGWSQPFQVVRGGAWYPQVIGLEEGCGDTECGAVGRFFMAGFSAWEIEFSGPAADPATARLLAPTRQEFARLFGSDRRCPW
ncbi:MAG: hypothetical protein U1E60_28460 [Reyranellaceae bacterium]